MSDTLPEPRYATPGDTCVDDRGEGAEPFRVMVRVRGGYRTADYWSHWRSEATQAEAERWAASLAKGTPGKVFLGTWRFAHPLP